MWSSLELLYSSNSSSINCASSLYSKYSFAYFSALLQSLIITCKVIFFLNASRNVFLIDKRFGCRPEHATSPFTTAQTPSIGWSSQWYGGIKETLYLYYSAIFI